MGGPEGWGARRGGGPNPEKVGPEGGPKGGSPKGGGRTVGAPQGKFHSFFSLWGFSRGILVVFEAPGRLNVRVWSSLVVV